MRWRRIRLIWKHKYRRAEETETRAEEWQTDDAEIVLVGYGIVARILKAVAAEARTEGLKVGVLRPITLYPFPKAHFQRLANTREVFVVVELSNGQMVEDVRLALNGARPVEFLSRVGGMCRRTKRCSNLCANWRGSFACRAAGTEAEENHV